MTNGNVDTMIFYFSQVKGIVRPVKTHASLPVKQDIYLLA